jgi:hypothetical protein
VVIVSVNGHWAPWLWAIEGRIRWWEQVVEPSCSHHGKEDEERQREMDRQRGARKEEEREERGQERTRDNL